MMSVTQPGEVFTGASPVQATGDVTATQPGEAPGMMRERAANMTATQPVEDPVTGRSATQAVEAPGVRTDVHSQPVLVVLWTCLSLVELWLLTMLVCRTWKTNCVVNWNPLMWSVTGKCCQTGSTVPSAELPDTACLLPWPPGPSVKIP